MFRRLTLRPSRTYARAIRGVFRWRTIWMTSAASKSDWLRRQHYARRGRDRASRVFAFRLVRQSLA